MHPFLYPHISSANQPNHPITTKCPRQGMIGLHGTINRHNVSDGHTTSNLGMSYLRHLNFIFKFSDMSGHLLGLQLQQPVISQRCSNTHFRPPWHGITFTEILLVSIPVVTLNKAIHTYDTNGKAHQKWGGVYVPLSSRPNFCLRRFYISVYTNTTLSCASLCTFLSRKSVLREPGSLILHIISRSRFIQKI